MLKNHIIIACKRLAAQKLHSAINIAGLAIGLACFILIALFVQYELGYDHQWSNADRVFRVSRDVFETEGTTAARPAGMPWRAAALLQQEFPQIERVARLDPGGAVVRSSQGEPVLERRYATADNALFEMFDFEWLAGDPATALTRPYDLVLTRSAARRHFGDGDPTGQTLMIGGGGPDGWVSLEVVGIIEDLPDDTHLSFELLDSQLFWSTVEGAEPFLDDWDNNVFHTYVLLSEGADAAEVQARAGEFFERHLGAGAGRRTGFTVTAVTDLHMGGNREGEMKPPGSAATVRAFSLIAVFVLLLACINFVNLATAQSAARSKEIGVRKVVGAGRARLVLQFLAESVFLTAIAVLVAVVIVELALPPFNEYLGRDLRIAYFEDPMVVTGLLSLALVTGLAAGAYPSLYLSAFRPERVLRGDSIRGAGAARFRKWLVVAQFAISITLLIGTTIVHQQMRFVRHIDLGYDKDGIVILGPNPVTGEEWETLKREWLSHPEILGVTRSDLAPLQRNRRSAEVRAGDAHGPAHRMQFLRVDHDFFETYRIEVVTGRAFSPLFGVDQQAAQTGGGSEDANPFILNEAAARQFGWSPEDAIGRRLEFGSVQGWRFNVSDASGPVVGVVKDIHFESVHSAIGPTIYRIGGGDASLRISGREREGTLEHIVEKWREFRPELPVSPRFLEQDFEAAYETERRQAQLLTVFSALAVFIACLGLLGLVSFATEQRTKEIGVRKVMGGTVLDIVRLFTGEFARLVLIANVIAWPVAYVLIQQWLATFAYRIDPSLFHFVAAGLLALALAALTVATVAARAAGSNAIHALRYE